MPSSPRRGGSRASPSRRLSPMPTPSRPARCCCPELPPVARHRPRGARVIPPMSSRPPLGGTGVPLGGCGTRPSRRRRPVAVGCSRAPRGGGAGRGARDHPGGTAHAARGDAGSRSPRLPDPRRRVPRALRSGVGRTRRPRRGRSALGPHVGVGVVHAPGGPVGRRLRRSRPHGRGAAQAHPVGADRPQRRDGRSDVVGRHPRPSSRPGCRAPRRSARPDRRRDADGLEDARAPRAARRHLVRHRPGVDERRAVRHAHGHRGGSSPGEEIEAGERFFLGDAEVRLTRRNV